MMRHVIIINGAAECGKDSFVGYCQKALIDRRYQVFNESSIDPVKAAMLRFLGWDGKRKGEEDRALMSDIKRVWDEHYDGSTRYCLDRITWIHSLGMRNVVIFVHIREPRQIQKIVDRFRAKYKPDYATISTLLVQTNRCIPSYSNLSDLAVENYHYDHVINNDDTPDGLEIKAFGFIEMLIKGSLGALGNDNHGQSGGNT